jgi:large subunit ribosomal protein L5
MSNTTKHKAEHNVSSNQSRLKEFYFKEIIPKMMKDFKFTNIHQVPRVTKIVLSMGLGKRDIKKNTENLTLIAGQKAVVTKAKKSVSQFSVRKGFDSGAKVTLRGNMMYHFLDRFLNIALLNWRDFPGVFKRAFSKQKVVTMSIGVKDCRIFPEIFTDAIRSEGLNVTICSNAKSIEEFKVLMEIIGFPIIGG